MRGSGSGLWLGACMLVALTLAGLTVLAALHPPRAALPPRSAAPAGPTNGPAAPSRRLVARLGAGAARTARAAVGMGSASAAAQLPMSPMPSPGLALQPAATDRAPAGSTAALDFRIVIPATLGMASQTRREGRAVQTVSIATERLPDRVRRTVSSP